MGDVTDKGHDATAVEGADSEQNDGGLVVDGGIELSNGPVDEQNSFQEETAATQITNAEASQISDGIEDVKMAASQGNATLYIGNICKLWTKERVLGALKSHGVENFEDILLPGDTKKEGKIKGFALLEFNTHSDAVAALERLRKSDVVFGLDSSVNVAFAQTPIHPSEEVLRQLKTVFIEGLADSWDQEKVIGICKQFGKIVKVKLSRIVGTKGKNFGYITFVSQESATACVDGINNTQIGDGEINEVNASIAQSHSKVRLEKRGSKNQVVRTINKENEIVKGKVLSDSEFGGGKPNKHVRTPYKLESTNRKRNNQKFNAGGNSKKGSEHDSRDSLKKQGGHKQRRQSEDFRKPKRHPYIGKEPDHGADVIIYKGRHAPGYTLSNQNHVYNTISGSKRPYADMEPHAGFIDPVNRKHRTPPVGTEHQLRLGYLEHAVAMRGQPRIPNSEPVFGSHGRPFEAPGVHTQIQPHIRVHEPGFGYHGRSHERYLEPAVRIHSHQSYAGYLEPAVRRQDISHAGYYESALGKDSRNSYDLTLKRVGAQDGHGDAYSAYGAGPALPPSYVPNYMSYGSSEGGSTVGAHYQGSGVRLYQRAYQ